MLLGNERDLIYEWPLCHPINPKEECIPVGWGPPAAIAIYGCHPNSSGTRHPPPRTRHPLEPGTRLWRRHPLGLIHPVPCGQTHTCKSHNLRQTSFAGGNDEKDRLQIFLQFLRFESFSLLMELRNSFQLKHSTVCKSTDL